MTYRELNPKVGHVEHCMEDMIPTEIDSVIYFALKNGLEKKAKCVKVDRLNNFFSTRSAQKAVTIARGCVPNIVTDWKEGAFIIDLENEENLIKAKAFIQANKHLANYWLNNKNNRKEYLSSFNY